MKQGIHPTTRKVKIVCSCGASFETMSTSKEDEIRIEICSNCHPYFTGKQKLVDTAGRVEKFKARMAKKQELASQKKQKVANVEALTDEKEKPQKAENPA